MSPNNEYLDEQFNRFAQENSPAMGTLLEMTVMQITFLQLLRLQFSNQIETDSFDMIRSHLMTSLEMTAQIADIPQEDVDRVVTKSIELVDSMNAIADPKRTNLH